ncbi:2-amino-4-hydroxy-6-hydroxymethyldihydropteridine diphosphokinase [Fontibacillus phaseoli]|uniref:2-amino-4-hydroxy-6-hydroxymethyldihydropteridine diphosphokinase n=1 Tax=Fontibacillus phaseoli TaxID=1416533 RepID=A0A369B5H9_9BACL|nr:2-amino-4-hydroxy-6-hydroxymethyldihydropteridine diphosphokinase [Fontibacillus phaseoli]RCX14944.1 2-amino-4-hydroxy-6-hydroxymethyldihydropteridine diphosphokinase [Fontibacillus phaseoli]
MTKHSTSDGSEAYIALGANLGDRKSTLIKAVALLDGQPDITVLRSSNLYETDPVGYVDQPNFVNMALALRTTLTPEALLKVMLEIELVLGRERKIRWGPRTVDLDLLWMEGQIIDTPFLTLPHPRMLERSFVLVPLCDIVPKGDATGLYELAHTALNLMDGKEGVRFWKTGIWPSASAHSGN